MLFTHFGVSGPVILSASSVITGIVKERPVRLSIDLKPAITDEQLDERILRDFSKEQNKAFKNSLDELLPKKLIPVIVMTEMQQTSWLRNIIRLCISTFILS